MMRSSALLGHFLCLYAFKAPIFKPFTSPMSRRPRLAVRVEPIPLPQITGDGDLDETATGYDLWWQGNSTEVVVPLKLHVDGELPSWLSGSLLRVGPGIFDVGGQKLGHLFDGLGKLTKFQISNTGEVNFQTRMLQSKLYNRTAAGHKPVSRFTMLPVRPALNALQRVRAVLNEPEADNTNIVVWRTGKQAHTCSDTTCESNAFDIDTLDARGHVRVTPKAANLNVEGAEAAWTSKQARRAQRTMTDATLTGAHKQRVINGTASVGWIGHVETDSINLKVNTVVNIYKDHPQLESDRDDGSVAQREFIGQLKLPIAEHGLPMIHSFQVTRRYVILVVCSLCVEPGLIGSKLLVLSEAFAGVQTFGWRERQNTTVFVMDIESADPLAGPLRTFTIDPMYMNHHINAWEEDGKEAGEAEELVDGHAAGVVKMDLIAYRDGSFLSDERGFGNLEVMRDPHERAHLKALKPTIRRYTLDMRLTEAEHRAQGGGGGGGGGGRAKMAVGAGGDPLDTIERLLAAPSPSRLRPSPRVLHAPWVAFDLRSTRFGAPTSKEEWPQPRGGVIDVTGQAALPIGSLHIEMPRFNERRHGAPYRYIWGVGAPLGVSTHVSGLVKVDLGANNHREENGRRGSLSTARSTASQRGPRPVRAGIGARITRRSPSSSPGPARWMRTTACCSP